MKAEPLPAAVCAAPPPLPRRRFMIVHNPAAGARRGRRLAAVVAALRERFAAAVTVHATAGPGDAEAFVRSLAPGACDALVAAGGDGTINEVVNGLAARRADAAAPPLGLIPLGTANVLANELGLTLGAAGTAEMLVHGGEREIHLGLADGRCFTMMAGVGFDARVVERLRPALKRWLGKGAYAVETLAELAGGGERRYRVTIDGRSWEVGSAIVAKGRFYGGRFVCAPAASLLEPRLHVCLFPGRRRIDAVRYIWGVLSGRIVNFRDYLVVPAERVSIDGPAGEPVQGDGDIVARLPVEIGLSPWRLRVIAGT